MFLFCPGFFIAFTYFGQTAQVSSRLPRRSGLGPGDAVDWFDLRHKSSGGFAMRLLPGCLAGVIFVVSLCLYGQAPAGVTSGETSIREIAQKYMDARERQDARALEALFTADADQLVSSGEWRKGRSDVVRGTLASSQNSGGKRTITVVSVRFLAPDVALADGRYELTGMAGGESRKMWTTLVLTRTADGWHIAAIRNMLPASPPPSK
jgi:uncharacterized protein (TIGR02246 family)